MKLSRLLAEVEIIFKTDYLRKGATRWLHQRILPQPNDGPGVGLGVGAMDLVTMLASLSSQVSKPRVRDHS